MHFLWGLNVLRYFCPVSLPLPCIIILLYRPTSRCDSILNRICFLSFMANPHGRVVFMNSPIMETREQEGYDDYEQAFSSSRCCCFKLFKWTKPDNEAQSLLNQKEVPERRETWLVTKLKEVKETSEIIAGPKWKNFTRKISGYVNNRRKQRNGQFQYSPQSYALNFDEGSDSEDEYDSGNLPDMSSRFSSVTTTNISRQDRHENR